MHPVVKILVGAVMVVVGVYSSVTFLDQLVALLKAGIGPLLVLVGAFIVWLETDEWKMRREQKQEEERGLQREFTPRDTVERDTEPDTPAQDYSEVLDGSVEEEKDRVREMEDPDYSALLDQERDGKDRKTLTAWLERRQ